VNSDHSEIAVEATEPKKQTPEKPLLNQGQQKDRGQESRDRGSGSGLAWLALLVALGAAAGTAWIWWQGQVSGDIAAERMQADIERLEGNDSRLTGQLGELSDSLESLSSISSVDPLAELDDRLAADRAQLLGLQESIGDQVALTRAQQQAVDALHARLLAAEAMLTEVSGRERDARGELDLAEVDYLLRLASERLQLFSDVAAADHALSLADSNLAALDNPAYLGVRQAIANARGDLAAVESPDIPAMAGRLDALQKAVPALPFPATDVPLAPSAPATDDGWWEKLKATFASLVTVRRSTEEENQRIGLLDQDLIRQRVWLQLEAAHLALMRRDQQAFGSALQRAQATSAEWFDPASSAVQSFESSVAQLEGTVIAVAWPDISGPWTQLRLLRSARTVPAPIANPAVAPAEPESGDRRSSGDGAEFESEPPSENGPDDGQ
jgi:uroporphyrin-3 C-methyltransferase